MSAAGPPAIGSQPWQRRAPQPVSAGGGGRALQRVAAGGGGGGEGGGGNFGDDLLDFM
jgi:hypothetical protein